MTFDLARILESKRALRRDLAARSIGEKLRMLDALRGRALSLRARATSDTLLQEQPGTYRVIRR